MAFPMTQGYTSEYIQQDAEIFYSLERQIAVNVPEEQGAEYGTALMDAFPAVIPTAEMVDDTDQVGDGSEFPRFVRLYRWQLGFGLGTRANTELCAILIARALGGDITTAVIQAGQSWDHDVIMQTRQQGRVPQATSFILPMTGGADFLLADCFIDSFVLSQTGDAQPTCQFTFASTGYHNRVRNYATLAADLPDPVTDTPEHHYFHGAVTAFEMNDGTLIDMSDAGRMLNWSFEFRNNIVISRRQGDRLIGQSPGSRQIETATAAGTITTAGNVSVTVTAAGLTGSPLTLLVPVLLGDTAAVWAGKVRAALAANAAISSLFFVGGSGTQIVLAKKVSLANDGTLNIALADDTSVGVTAAPTSANTSAGVASVGAFDVRTGAYARNVIHGRRQATLTYAMTLDQDLPEYDRLKAATEITGIKIIAKGDPIDPTLINVEQYEQELRIPIGQENQLSGGQDNNFLSINSGILALKDTVTEGLVTARTRNNVALFG